LHDGREFPRQVHSVSDASIHALPTDGAVDVRGIAEQEDAALVEPTGNSMMDVVRRKPIDVRNLNAQTIEGACTDIAPGKLVAFPGGFFPHYPNEPRLTTRMKWKHADKIGLVKGNIQFAIHYRAGGGNVGHVEQVRVSAAWKTCAEDVANCGVGAIASGEVGRRAG
jgi:hypothetical protein